METIVDPRCTILMKDYNPTSDISFAQNMCPIMIEADYNDDHWSDFRLIPYRQLTIDPTCKGLHYGQEIFEGLKAYYVDKQGPYLFRPYENAKRFNASAERMVMPTIDENQFVNCLKTLVAAGIPAIPENSGQSLYVRPFMFATESSLGIDISNSFKFLVVAGPCGSYFSDDGIKAYLEREQFRSFIGGTGRAKTGGNYAASLQGSLKAKAFNCQQVLWVNAQDKNSIEEFTAMNFFAVINGEIFTPPKSDTILDGITRNSIVDLGCKLGLVIKEENIDADKLIDLIKSGKCTECFGSGTAGTITSISHIVTSDQEEYTIGDGSMKYAKTLKEGLLAIQEGRAIDEFNWRYQV